MIRLYDIVEAASTWLKEGTLVLHRSMKTHPLFKVYKKFCYYLYKVVGKNKELVFSYEKTVNAPADSIDKVWDECDKLYLEVLISWFASDEYKLMRKDAVI